MISSSDRIVSTTQKLSFLISHWGLHGQISDICKGINDQIEALELGSRFLAFLVEWNHKLTDTGVVELRLASKIKVTIQDIAKQANGKEVRNFRKKIEKIGKDRQRTYIDNAKLQRSASRTLDVFTNLNAKIDLLKPEICKDLSALQSFQLHYPILASDGWREFVKSILLVLKEFPQKHVSALLQSLYHFQKFLDGLNENLIAQDILIHVVIAASRATIVSCHWWACQFNPSMIEDVSIALLDLRRKIEFTDSESLDLILRQLKIVMASDTYYLRVGCFVNDILPFQREFQKLVGKLSLLPLVEELESLTIIFVNMLEKDIVYEQRFLLEFKLLISEIEESFSSYSTENLLLNFLAKSCLIKTEVLLVDVRFLQFDETHINVLKERLQQIKESPEERAEDVNQILAITETTANVAESLQQSFHAKDITRNIGRTTLHLLFVNILLFKLGSSENFMFFVKDTVQSFIEVLQFLINIFIYRGGFAIGGVLDAERIELIAMKVNHLYHSYLSLNIAEEMVEDVNLKLSSLLDGIKLNMTKLIDVHLNVPRSKFPKKIGLGFFDSLLSKLRELLYHHNSDLFGLMKQQFVEISGHLKFFRDLLGDILETEEESQDMRDLCVHVKDVAYEVDYVVDLIVIGKSYGLIWLYHVLQDIRHMKKQITNVHEKKTLDVKVHNVPETSRHLVSKSSAQRIAGDILSDQQKEIIDRLVGGYEKRDTISIVGMPGVGKTTLAKNVYNNPHVVCHFHIRAWCCVTEVYRKRELLLEILSHIILLTDNISGMSNEDLELKLRRLLLKQKYLIVIDDIWNTEAWDDLQSCFPEDGNGSRILITSRINHVALTVKAHSDPLHLQLLSDTDSWELLRTKIFDEACCPVELITVGREIATKCKGLPLAIVAMAGILKRIARQENQWKEIARNISSLFHDPEQQCHDILELSYKLLPVHLQACFLYFGAFLEDREIPIRKLIRLWIAEGFVPKTKLKSPEDLAEDYLEDLIGRNLVLFAQSRSGGGTKACRVHDMLRSLCQSKAKEENFLQVITMSNESDDSSDDFDFVVDVDSIDSSNYKKYEDHRLCFYSKRYHFVESRPSGSHARSLMFFATNDKYSRSSYDVSFICHNFFLLKVLDLECINMGPSFPNGIEQMCQLRYLAVSGDVEYVPSSIESLWNLETFVVKGLKGRVNLPDAIWCLKSLRHVHISDVAIIKLQDDRLGNFSLLDCLVTLSSLFLRNGQETNNMLGKFPNLRKLGCIFSKSSKCSANGFPKLDVLTRLESLKIRGRALHTAEFSLPLSLKKLTLSNFRLPWSHISVIGRLQNLEILKLLSKAYDGETWDMVEGEFHNLRFLKLESLNIAKWNASSDNLPKLEQLVLRNCKLLEEVPSSFVEICTLQIIEVQWCGKLAEESARKMRQEADELLKVVITSDLESRSSP